MLAAGARHVFLPRFDGAALLAAIQQHSVTSFIAGAGGSGWCGMMAGQDGQARIGVAFFLIVS